MRVGDINSTARGSGARFNDGKAPLHLVPAIFYAEAAERAGDFRLADGCKHIHSLQTRKDNGVAIPMFCYQPAELSIAASVFEYGTKKYAAWNWTKGMSWSIPVGCALRHAEKMILVGPNCVCNDDDSRLPHWGHFLCNLIMLDWFRLYYPEGDDIRILPHE